MKKSTLPAEVRKNFFGRFAVLDMEIAKSFWFSSRSREENAAQAIVQGKENKFSFPCTMAWADRESPKEILCQQNDAKSAQTLSRKVLGGVGTFAGKVLTAPVTGVSVTSSPTNPN